MVFIKVAIEAMARMSDYVSQKTMIAINHLCYKRSLCK